MRLFPAGPSLIYPVLSCSGGRWTQNRGNSLTFKCKFTRHMRQLAGSSFNWPSNVYAPVLASWPSVLAWHQSAELREPLPRAWT